MTYCNPLWIILLQNNIVITYDEHSDEKYVFSEGFALVLG